MPTDGGFMGTRMDIKFALSLSVDGIVLLHKSPTGWLRVGEADVTSSTLAADMAELREKAAALGKGDLHTKLILPDDQIRLLTIETAMTTLEDIETEVSSATPLALDEVSIDYDRNGGRTYIAAVARQTLAEAEGFAREHAFEPVSFVAVPEPYTFSGEIFFGPTRFAKEDLGLQSEITRDETPPVEVSPAPVIAVVPPAIDPVADVASETVQPTATAEKAEETDTVDATEPEAPAEDAVAAPDATTDHTAEDPAAVPVFAARKRDTDTPQPDPSPIATFNRRAQTEADTTEDASPAAPLRATRAPFADKKPAAPAQYRKPVSTPLPAPIPALTDAALARGVAQSHAATGGRRYMGAVLTVLLLAAMGLVGLWANNSVDGGVAGLIEIDPGLQDDTAPEIAAPVIQPSAPQTPAETGLSNTQVADVAPAQPSPVAPTAEEATPPTPIVTAVPGRVLSPSDAARIYAATGVWQRAPRLPDAPSEADQSQLDGLHSFAVLNPTDGLTRPAPPETIAANHELPILTPLNPAPAGREPARDADGFIRAAATGTTLPSGLRIYGRGPALRPPLRPTDEAAAPAPLDDLPVVSADIVVTLQDVAFIPESDLPPPRAFRAPALSQPIPLQQQSGDAPTGLAGARFITPPPAPVEPDVEEAPAAQTASVESDTPSDDTIINVIAGRPAITPPLRPGTEEPEQVATDLPDSAATDDARETDVAAASDAATGFTPTDDNVFVEVIQGRPVITPPLRPGTEVPVEVASTAPEAEQSYIETEVASGTTLPDVDADAAAETPLPDTENEVAILSDIETGRALPNAATTSTTIDTPLIQDARFVGFRPALRPEGLAPASLVTFEAIPALATLRPTLRPADLVPEAPAEPEVTPEPAVVVDPATENANGISAIVASIAAAAPPSQIINPTQRAIVRSPRPDTRPANFARVVASAQNLQQRAQTRAVAAATSAAVVPQQVAPATAPVTGGQSSTTVARAATADNALRLRDMNLIGVYGKPGARRALVRMPNGRFVKVEVGSSLDGGRVTAIGDSALNFVKRGQTYALQLPAG